MSVVALHLFLFTQPVMSKRYIGTSHMKSLLQHWERKVSSLIFFKLCFIPTSLAA